MDLLRLREGNLNSGHLGNCQNPSKGFSERKEYHLINIVKVMVARAHGNIEQRQKAELNIRNK
jgi:hypothetical protein